MGRFGNGVACLLVMIMVRAEAQKDRDAALAANNPIERTLRLLAAVRTKTPCTVLDGTGVSSVYPCMCGASAMPQHPLCGSGEICTDNGYSSIGDQMNQCDPTGAPTPNPTQASMSGDPIVSVNGYRVKFELPSGPSSLMWGDDDLEIFAKAEVMTPDRQSQWFSDFSFVVNGHHAANIQRKEIKTTSKEVPGALNTLFVTTVDEAAHGHSVTRPGSYPVRNGTLHIIVQRDGARVGPLPREVVTVKSQAISCSIVAERAKKFSPNEKKALKYSHLDIILHKMSRNVKKGIFAEFSGLIPMSSKTASMIKKMTFAAEE